MKKYSCPSCSSTVMFPLPECPDCGTELAPGAWREVEEKLPPKPEDASCIHLVGDIGQLVFRKMPGAQDVGYPLLSKIASQAKLANRVQFQLSWKGHACFISPVADTKNETAVNGSVIHGETELSQGDSVALCGRKSGRLGMMMAVQYFVQ